MLDLSPGAKPIVRRSDQLRVTVEEVPPPKDADGKTAKDAKPTYLVREALANSQLGHFTRDELEAQFVNNVTRHDEPAKPAKKAKAKE